MTASRRHETRALLRAHLSAATGYRHLTRRCAVCRQLQRLAMEPTTHAAPPVLALPAPPAPAAPPEPDSPPPAAQAAESAPSAPQAPAQQS